MKVYNFFVHKDKNQNIRIGFIAILMFCLFYSCGSKEKEYVDLPYDRETIPSMRTDSVYMLISDSGIVKYKVIAQDWQVYDNAANPYWYFPEGLYLEQFDTLFNKLVTLKADTAWNYSREKKWKLKGHVFIKNIKDETFSSEELIWNEKTQRFNSEKYIEITRPNKLILKGYGFDSNQDMTEYKVFKPFDTQIIVEENKNKQDSIQ